MENDSGKDLKRRERQMQFTGALILIVCGVGLLIAGFIVPPVGDISPSVLVAFGEILTFIGSLFGIDYHYKSTR